MNLLLPTEEGIRYHSRSQAIRAISESWAERNIFCAACPSERLARARNNCEAFDFACSDCGARYQLKATCRPFASKIVDAGYDAMMRAIRQDRLPHFLILRYNAVSVSDLMLLPAFSLSASAIEARPPLLPTARRAGWIGCNILLSFIPPEGRIALVQSGVQVPRGLVRTRFLAIADLSGVRPSLRGWTLDVLTALRKLGKQSFTIDDAYGLEAQMGMMHPNNTHIRPKIRQQLQVLRDLGHLHFKGRGTYEFAGEH